MIKNVIKLRIILWHILALVVLFFIYLAIVPSGHISYTYNFEKDNSFISSLYPKERVEPIENGIQKIIGDPVYFSLETPRTFDNADVNIKFKNNNPELNQIIESGVLVDKTIWRYKLNPVDNFFLDNLYDKWNVLEKDDLVLFSRGKIASSSYSSIDSFLSSPPPSNKIATYNYDLNIDYTPENYASSSDIYVLDKRLRGPYQILTYIDNEDISFDFTFSDLNKNKDSDEININLYYGNQLIDTEHLDDDGIVDDSGEIKESRNISLNLANMPKGVYKIELRVNDDIVTDRIETKQNKLSFLNKLWLADDSLENFSVFTDSNIIYAQTTNPASIQKIEFASSGLDVEKTYKQYSVELQGTSTEIFFKKGDIVLAGNGFFSFELSSLMNPNIKKIDSSFNLNNSQIEYILARYKKPDLDGEYLNKTINFDLAGAYREDSKYSFLISIPGLRADDEVDDSIEISEIKIDLYGTDLVSKIKGILE